MDKDKIDLGYIYDTPTGIIQKEGNMFRGAATHDPNRPLWVKVMAIFFACLVFLLPGLTFLIGVTWSISSGFVKLNEFYVVILPILVGAFCTYGGIVIVRANMRKKSK